MTLRNTDGDLGEARARIDDIDVKMARLFEERMEAVACVAAYKAERGMSILDPQREAEVLEERSKLVSDELKPYYLQFQESAMEASRRYQRFLMEGTRVAYSGVEGAFAWVAASRAFPGSRLCAFPDFRRAYDAVVTGDCDCVVLPVENSEAGEVGQVMDLIFNGRLYANRVFYVPIVQNVLGLPGARLADINMVTSHPQALAQCADYIEQRGWEVREATNTAVAAASLIQADNPSVAAIASAEAAELYGLEVLDHDVNASSDNTTCFAVLSRLPSEGPSGQFVLMFTVKNEAGALARAIDIVAGHGFNMSALHSRPMKSLAWSYYFYIGATGDISSPAGQSMLEELSQECDRLKVVGRFPAHDPLDQ